MHACMATVTQDMRIASAKCMREAIMESWNTMGNRHNTAVCMSYTSDVYVDVCICMFMYIQLWMYV